MGNCYYTKIAFTKETLEEENLKNLVKALNIFIEDKSKDRDDGYLPVNFCLDEIRSDGKVADINTLDGLMKIIFADWEGHPVEKEVSDEETTYTNEFDASYSWELVMDDAFHAMEPFLKDGCYLFMDMDEGSRELKIVNGEIVED